MSDSRTGYVNSVIRLYLNAPDTTDMPRDTDWPIAGAMYDDGIHLEIVELAFHIAFLRRYLANLERDGSSPQIRSLAYFRAVINSLTVAERDPSYMAHVASSYSAKRDDSEAYLRRFQERSDQSRNQMRDRT